MISNTNSPDLQSGQERHLIIIYDTHSREGRGGERETRGRGMEIDYSKGGLGDHSDMTFAQGERGSSTGMPKS